MTLPKTITIAREDRPVFEVVLARLPKNRSGEQIIGSIDWGNFQIKIHSKLSDREQSAALIGQLAILNNTPDYENILIPTLLDSLYSAEWYNSGRPEAVMPKPSKETTKTSMVDMGDDVLMIKRVGH